MSHGNIHTQHTYHNTTHTHTCTHTCTHTHTHTHVNTHVHLHMYTHVMPHNYAFHTTDLHGRTCTHEDELAHTPCICAVVHVLQHVNVLEFHRAQVESGKAHQFLQQRKPSDRDISAIPSRQGALLTRCDPGFDGIFAWPLQIAVVPYKRNSGTPGPGTKGCEAPS